MQKQTNSNPNTLIYKPKSKVKHELKPIWPKYSKPKPNGERENFTNSDPLISPFTPYGVSILWFFGGCRRMAAAVAP